MNGQPLRSDSEPLGVRSSTPPAGVRCLSEIIADALVFPRGAL